MRRHTSIISKPIQKLQPSKLKETRHISSKLTKNRKNQDIHVISDSEEEVETGSPVIICLDDDTPQLLRDPEDYNKIGEMPIYKPTREELGDPFLLLQSLRAKGFEKTGAVKVQAPPEWSEEFSFNPVGKRFNTRKQMLKNMIRGKSFEYNLEGYTLEEYQEFTDKFAREYVHHSPFTFTSPYRANEYEYWANVEDAEYAKYNVTVEYAADLPSSKFGSGFPTMPRGRMIEELDTHELKQHPFNLNNLSQARDSLFQIITTKIENISGISSPWVYLGMLFASFCWHVEDMYMYSVNYMHKGAPKTWYCVPGAYKEALDDTIKEKYGELFIMEPGLMYNITQTMNPLELVKRNIPVYRTEQKPGEFIITFPKVYHAGFSHGFNVAEAVNVAACDWLPYAKNAMEDYALDGFNKKGSFPIEWMIIENILLLDDLDFTNEAREKLLEEYAVIKEKEMKSRETIHQCYKRISVKKFPNSATRYDANVCNTCQNYTYLSYLSCIHCNKIACIHHITVCDCLNSTIILNVRYTDEELDGFSKKYEKPKRKSSRSKIPTTKK